MVLVANHAAHPNHCTLRRQPIIPHHHQRKTSRAISLRSCCTSSCKRANLAILLVGARADLLRLLARVVALVLVARLVLVLATIGDCASVAVVCVNTAEHAAVAGDHVVDDDVASAAVAAAVAAGAHDFAVVCCVEILDVEGAFGQMSVTLEAKLVLIAIEGAYQSR